MRTDVSKSQEPVEQGGLLPAEELLPLVYEELRRIAAHKMAREAPGQTLQPTALVHEAWLRLGADGQPPWRNRAHFFAAAAEAMRRILVERARRRTALKRGGGTNPASLDEVEIPMAVADDERLLAVDEALEQFAAIEPRKAELVKLRYFTGMTFEEAASVLGIGVRTAKDWWAYARASLAVALDPSLEVGGPLSPSRAQAGRGGEKKAWNSSALFTAKGRMYE
jgi:RNA polymerase sigma factor (TIGR02999 family)